MIAQHIDRTAPRQMHRSAILACLFAALLPVLSPAQEYPTRLVRIVIPFPPGGGIDRMARLASEKLRERWNQPFIVENRAGGGGNIAAELVANAPADGYTLLYAPPQQYVINKLLYAKLSYDPDSFAPVSVLTLAPNVLAVHPAVPAESLQQLIALAKAQPGKLNYSSPGNASTNQLTIEMMNSLAGVKVVHVPFNGTAPALTSLLAGQVDMMVTELGNVVPHVRAGKLRALAVGSEKRNAFLPDIPAMSEVLPGVVSTTWAGVGAPGGTPADIVNRLSGALAEAMKAPDIVKYLQSSFVDPVGSTPAQMATLIRQERERWGKVIRETGARAD
jgi:tripartite-type tricarboxylate transporter receptor subunit TctC